MTADRIREVVSADGTRINARVQGEGPPLLLLPAGPGDSQTCWGPLLPYLGEHFTCYLTDTRGRGLSDDSPDHDPERLVEDVLGVARAAGEPVGIVDWGSALWALVASRGDPAVAAVAAYEPAVNEVLDEEIGARLAEVLTQVSVLAEEGRTLEAARHFADNGGIIYAERDLASGAPAAFWEASAPNLPLFVREQEQMTTFGPQGTADPFRPADIAAPLLLLQGSNTSPWFADSARLIADCATDCRMLVIDGAGHFGPLTEPASVAAALVPFFEHHLSAA
jgi:pimeloyl-ACP methyl ester carboxylesterase